MELLGFFIGFMLEPITWGIALISFAFVWTRNDGLKYFIGFVVPTLISLFLQPSRTPKEDFLVIILAMLIKCYVILKISNYMNKKKESD